MADSQPTAGADAPQPTVDYKPIPGFDGYRAGSDGTIWSAWVAGHHARITSKWRLMNQTVHAKSGYKRIRLRKTDGTFTTCLSHRIILLAFRGECPAGMQALHGGDDKNNNGIDNLKWGTPKENCAERWSNGRQSRGAAHHFSKLTVEQVIALRELHDGGASLGELSARFGICKQSAWTIVKRKTWRHV